MSKNEKNYIRKRNADLAKKLDDMKFKLEYNKTLNQESYKKAKALIEELESIKIEWRTKLDDLIDKQEKYQVLINDLQELRDEMASKLSKRPKQSWYKRLFKKK